MSQARAHLFCCYHIQGRLLAGVGRLLRIYDLGKKKLLRKCENKVPISSLSTVYKIFTSKQFLISSQNIGLVRLRIHRIKQIKLCSMSLFRARKWSIILAVRFFIQEGFTTENLSLPRQNRSTLYSKGT